MRISKTYAAKEQFDSAYVWYKRFSKFNQKFINEGEAKQLAIEVQRNQYEEAERERLAEQQRQEIERLAEAKRQRLIKYSLAGGAALLILLALVQFRAFRNKSKANKIIAREKERSEDLLLNILPAETAEELKRDGESKPKPYDNVSVIFTDFKGFTFMAEKLTADELVGEIDHCFRAFDDILGKYRIEKIKTIGDAYMCVAGLPEVYADNAEEAIKAALDIRDFMLKYKAERDKEGLPGFEIRIGVHTGPVVAGIVGVKKFAYDIWGDTVNTAARMESSGESGKVNISGTTQALVKDRFDFEFRGKVKAKNKGEIDMYFVERN